MKRKEKVKVIVKEDDKFGKIGIIQKIDKDFVYVKFGDSPSSDQIAYFECELELVSA